MRTLLVLAVACVGVYAQFSEGGKQSILNAHNDIRSRIAKGNYVAKGNRKESATNMLKMVSWDFSTNQAFSFSRNGTAPLNNQLKTTPMGVTCSIPPTTKPSERTSTGSGVAIHSAIWTNSERSPQLPGITSSSNSDGTQISFHLLFLTLELHMLLKSLGHQLVRSDVELRTVAVMLVAVDYSRLLLFANTESG